MEAAVGTASSLLGKVLTKLSEGLVAAYVDSLELGHNSEQIQTKLMHTQGLLQLAEGRDASNVTALPALLEKLSNKADEAEDLLDELHYFKIQDQLDGTNYAMPDLGDGLRGHAHHARHAARHTVGNWFPCFSCSRAQDDDSAAPAAVSNSPHPHRYATNSATACADDGGHVDKLHFDRVTMSIKIKSVIEEIHSLCDPVSDLLGKIPSSSTPVTQKRPQIGSTIIQDTLHGRRDIFEKTVHDITSGTHHGQNVSVLPIVGPGGIGKTTFTQHLYNDGRTEEHFAVMVWVCVSTDFDVLKLTQQIHNCIPATENETSSETTNLDRLQKSIAQRLKSKRFLIVLDDIWKCNSEDEWKTLLAPFTKGEAKGSMVLVTTRFPKLAGMMKTIDPVELQGLESNDFFTFFESCIFGEHKPRDYEDELGGIAREIARKLKGSPLAAKTVGRLLKNNLSREHWHGVLHNHEWRNQKNDDDIIPSLKISYHYLPFHLKKCFSYCTLYPEDYRFSNSEINRFWIAIGIIDSSHPSDTDYMEGLVENGFLMKGVSDDHPYYVMHDLMHELSRSVSAQECLNISDLDFRAEAIPQSIRHISITIENRYDEKFREEMGKLKGRIDNVNLRTLMIFREYEERIIEILKDTFMETKGLRVLFIAVKSLESLPQRFSSLIHLQYLQIQSPYGTEMTLPSTLSRFYHLKFLDLISWYGSSNLPKDISRLVNLRDFLAKKELHANVPEAGKMKYLRELKEFHVKKESVGFDLRELGELRELGGALSIHNLENVATKEEASSAKLVLKSDLKELTLVWGREHPTDTDADIVDALQPHSNLTALGIINHGGTTCPSWLCPEIRVNNLKTLHLHGVSWGILPPFGQLPYLRELSLKSISGLRQFGPDYGGVRGKCLVRLKKVLFHDLSDLVQWVVEPNCHMFPSLESIDCRNCPNLCVMPFSEWSCTKLCRLHIDGCPKLCLPPMPHTSTLTGFSIKNGSEMFSYHQNAMVIGKSFPKKMVVRKYAGALAFHNLGEVEDMSIRDVSHISWTDLEKLKSLRKLVVGRCDSMFCGELDGSVVFLNMDKVESLCVNVSHLTGKLLSKVFNSCPALAKLEIDSSLDDQEERVIQFPSSSSLQELSFFFMKGLVLLPAEDGGGLQDTTSLQSLNIWYCNRLFSRWPMGEAGGAPMANPFPASLRKLGISGESSMWSMALLSNLTSLTHLNLLECDNLTVDGFNPLITVNLVELEVWNCSGNSMAADLLSEVAMTKTMQEGSFHLEKLNVDSISAVLVAPICNHLSATLHKLAFYDDMRAKGFTEEQENALQLLTSLRTLQFIRCKVLQCLPQGLSHLLSLQALKVISCPQLRLLPEDGFPTSLQSLSLGYLSADQKEQAEELKGTYPNLRIHYLYSA